MADENLKELEQIGIYADQISRLIEDIENLSYDCLTSGGSQILRITKPLKEKNLAITRVVMKYEKKSENGG